MKNIWQFLGLTQDTSKQYSWAFIAICIVVIMIGGANAGSKIANLKQGIDIKIAQREVELNQIFDEQDKKSKVEYQMANDKYQLCLEAYKKGHPRADGFDLSFSYLTGCSRPYDGTYGFFGNRDFRYGEDSNYRELTRIKNTSSFQLFIEKFSFGWWGVIALVAVFLLNLLIALVKLSTKYVPTLIRASGVHTKSTKTNIGNMPAFQRYLLLIMLLIFITLVFVLIKL